MQISFEDMSVDMLRRYHAYYSQVNHLTGKINNPELVKKTSQLIAQKKEEQNALLH